MKTSQFSQNQPSLILPEPGQVKSLSDLLAHAEYYAAFCLKTSGSMPPTLFIAGSGGLHMLAPSRLANDFEKDDFAITARLFCVAHGATMAVLASEAWMLEARPGEDLDVSQPPSQSPGRREIVALMGTSAYFAPASSAMAMARAYLRDEKRLLPCAAHLDGEYGHRDLFMGVPVVIGGGGIERVVEIPLTSAEKAMLEKSAESVKSIVDVCRRTL